MRLKLYINLHFSKEQVQYHPLQFSIFQRAGARPAPTILIIISLFFVFLLNIIGCSKNSPSKLSKQPFADKIDLDCNGTIYSIAGTVEYMPANADVSRAPAFPSANSHQPSAISHQPKSSIWQPAEMEQCLKVGDTVRTLENSALQILLSDKSKIKLSELSIFKISALNKNKLSKRNVSKVDITSGTVWLKLEKETKKSAGLLDLVRLKTKVKKLGVSEEVSFYVRTPTAQAGVRGTEFVTRVENPENVGADFAPAQPSAISHQPSTTNHQPSAKLSTEFFTLEGNVEVSDIKGEKSYILSAGEATHVDADSPPSPPEEFDKEDFIESIKPWLDTLDNKKDNKKEIEKLDVEIDFPTLHYNMVHISAGDFLMGDDSGDEDEKPQFEKFVDDFYIDMYEFPNKKGEEPREVVSWDEAEMLCKSQKKRLCTEAEWEKVCKGQKNNTWTFGSEFIEGICNIEGKSVEPSGNKISCKNEYGVYDMTGNLWEWTSDYYESYPKGNENFYMDGYTRVMRGGSWFTKNENARCSTRTSLTTDEKGILHNGVRCCR